MIQHKRIRRILTALLAAAMVTGAMTGCGDSGGGGTSANASGGGAASTAGGSGETLSFKITTVGFGDDPTGKLVQTTWLEKCGELMGKKIEPQYEFIHMMDYEQKIKIICAGGDIPDLLTYWKDTQPNLIKFGEQGLFEELTQHMDALPNYSKVLAADSSAKETLYSDSGKLYGFYNARYQPDGDNLTNACAGIRKDILDELNLEIPDTVEGIYNAAKAMKAAYPDKYPMILHEEWQPPEAMLYAANHTRDDRYFNGTEFKFGPMEDSYKDALIELNRWYSEGLISPDYFTHTSENGAAAVGSGDAMIIPSIWDGYPGSWEKDYPDQEWVLLPSVKNEKYGEPWVFYAGSPDLWKLNVSYCVLIGAKSKVTDDMLKLMDLQYSDEIVDLLTWGIEGETYEVNAEGDKHMTQKYIDDPKLMPEIALGSGTCRPGVFPQPQNVTQMAETSPQENIFYNGEMYRGRVFDFLQDNYDEAKVNPASKVTLKPLTTEENENYANIMTAVKTFTDEQRVKFIKGERSFDDWDNYLKEIQQMGDVQTAMDIYNAKVVK